MTCWNLIQVLVDAECTHDGSIRHIHKFDHWGWETLERRVLDAERTDSLTVLQVIGSIVFIEVFEDEGIDIGTKILRFFVPLNDNVLLVN